ncbi:MAG: hypothetical protein JXR25_06125 [Pontiellaceae bacterium]|nr:hypothetical protein [Pontiellaceae bacterium]MBN2784385.1 hypothetical protein [Pontiellaceae bacterium]
MKRIMGITAALLLAGTGSFAQETGDVSLLLGGGGVISPGFVDFIDDAYSAYSDNGGYGWLDFYAGLEYRIDERFCVIAGGDMLLNGIDVSGGPLDESYSNMILVPSVYGQLWLNEEQTLYLNGGLNLPIPMTGSDLFDYKNDGIGFGGNVGVRLAEIFRIEGGISYIPVEVDGPGGYGHRSYNFGGLQLRALLSF